MHRILEWNTIDTIPIISGKETFASKEGGSAFGPSKRLRNKWIWKSF